MATWKPDPSCSPWKPDPPCSPYRAFLAGHAGGEYDGHYVCACPYSINARGEHFFSIPLPADLPAIMERVLSSEEFLSPHGVRSLSRIHAAQRELGEIPGYTYPVLSGVGPSQHVGIAD